MSPARMARIESAMRTVLAFNEMFNHHDIASLSQLISDDCLLEDTGPAPDGAAYLGRAAILQFWQRLFNESPDCKVEIEEIFGQGERCILRWRYSQADPAGTRGRIRGVDIFKVKNGTICEILSYAK